MFDWREWFPVEALAPFIGGLLVWFGMNYAVLAPQVIGPRLADRYYLPACTANVASAKQGFEAETAARVASFEAELQDRAAAAQATVQDQLGNVFGDDEYGQALQGLIMGMGGGARQLEGAIGLSLQEQRQAFLGELAAGVEDRRAAQRFSSADAFCGCNVAEAYAERMELAAFTASFRVYRPDMIDQLEVGTFFEACGPAPVVE